MRNTTRNTTRSAVRGSVRFALRLGGVAGVLGAFILVGTLLLPSDGKRCLRWQERPLVYTDTTPARLRVLRAQTPIHEAPGLVSMGLFPGNFGGIALPDRVVISARLGGAATPGDKEHLVWHEIVHVEQMRQDGVRKFLLRYTTDWVRGRLEGCPLFTAYEAIRYEREADLYALGMELVEWAQGSGVAPVLLNHDTTQPGMSGASHGKGLDDISLRVVAEHLVASGFP
jgi:hypothetical protein